MKTKPCKDCPFLKDGTMRTSLALDRRKDIADSLLNDGDFACHKTTSSDKRGKPIVTPESTRCIGAAIWLDAFAPGGKFSNLCFRIGAMRKDFPINLPANKKVCQSYDEFVKD